MDIQLEKLLSSLCSTISKHDRTKQMICDHYDRLFNAVKEAGFTEFVAHHWTVGALSRIFGGNKVVSSIAG